MANPTYISLEDFNNTQTTPLNFVDISGSIGGVSMNLVGMEPSSNRLVFTMDSMQSTNLTESSACNLSMATDVNQPGTTYYFWYDIGTDPTGTWTLSISKPGGGNVTFKKRSVGGQRPR
jgi:hypothetical protein